MLKAKLAALVNICTHYAWVVIVIALFLSVFSGIYAVRNFAINTNVNQLISPDLPWRQRELAFVDAFQGNHEKILAVVDAATSERATAASRALTQKLAADPALFPSVQELSENPFFARNGLLFLPADQVADTVGALAESQPLVQVLVADPSWRGLIQALSFSLQGITAQKFTLDDMVRPLTMFAQPIEDELAGRPASFSWRELVNKKAPTPNDLRRFIEVSPVLDYGALEPGKKATDAIRQAAADLHLDTQYHARLRLTGAIPIQDEEFATLKDHAAENALGTIIVVLTILWLALKSPKIILAVFISIFMGLAITAAIGLRMVGALNPISIAFAVLFVGIGVDFGIQFSVRYRAERYEINNLRIALANAAKHLGVPLTLAATATAAGFLSFLPTDYRGVSELGQIAGVGMLIAYLSTITLLPALLKVLNPPGEKEPLGYAALAPVDRFMERHRISIIVGTAIVVLGGLPLLYHLRFDFNPINLNSPKVESIATYLDLRSDPATGASTIEVLAPSLADAKQEADRISKLPEVSHVMTIESFVPDDQPQKLEAIGKAAKALGPALAQTPRPAPTDAESVTALQSGADTLSQVIGSQNGPGAVAAKRLADALTRLAKADPATRANAQDVFVAPLEIGLDGLRTSLQAEPITDMTLPADLTAQWLKPDGRARLEVYPKGDPNDNEVLRQFARGVLAVEPQATGGPISILESGNTVIRAFIQAGGWALASIAFLLWIVLRRFTDVLLTLIPLLVAGMVTLELCVVIGMPLNFANIIALPLLLGVGVAFKIYYITAWRSGQTGLLQSSLTRAVIFSAMTTATAFGSLWLSSHPGTSSMGKLLALSLACTLAAAVLFQPVLMGPPREIGDS
ncbi:MAG TPA: MMPL family transporter [Xanthobacteraceae bacterium]|nr:MMPL family transporter [Xanthobacteraceae bacterium]